MLEFKLQKNTEGFKKFDNLKKRIHKSFFCKYINVNSFFVNIILYIMLIEKKYFSKMSHIQLPHGLVNDNEQINLLTDYKPKVSFSQLPYLGNLRDPSF